MPEPAETTLLESGDVKVTNLRVVIGGKTYALSNITSVEMGRKDATGCMPGVLIFGGIVLGIIAVAQFGEKSYDIGAVWAIFGVAAIGLGVLAMRSAKPQFTVKVGSASGENNILSSTNESSIRQIVDAVNQAIVQRG